MIPTCNPAPRQAPKRQGVKGKWRKGMAPKKISHLKKPDGLSLENWQIALRRQIATTEPFRVRNVGGHPLFSTFEVKNPKTARAYRVVVRGEALEVNYCTCPDFSANTLGTCKHIERVLKKLRGIKGAKEALRKGHISKHSSLTLRYGPVRRVALCLGQEASNGFRALAGKFFDADGFLSEQGFRRFHAFVKAAKEEKADVRYHQDALDFIARVRDESARKERIARLFPQGAQGPAWDKMLQTTLFPYQKEGALFAARAGRCIIADEMGLGKTVQAIAASEILARTMGLEKVLIVCPASLKFQWKQEIERFTDRSARIVGGLWHRRQPMYGEEGFFKIIGYDVVYRDADTIAAWAPDLIVLDEAQRIKNWKTRTAKSVKKLSSPYAIVLTGTPLENRLEELHSIVEFVDRYRLGPLFRFLHRHRMTETESTKVVGYKDLHAVGKTLQPLLIRRAKKEVASQLPGRLDKHYFVEMTQPQWDIHEENKEIVGRIVNKWKRYHFLTEQDQRRLMIALQNMRMACDSTYLLDEKTLHGKKVDELEVQLREIFETPAAKVVIFTQWLRMAELVAAMLNVNGWKYAQLHGGIPGNKRGELIDHFKQKPECRVFLSTDAGGVGLNLQNAATVINLDMPWNPAVLEQRIGRVHRLGQTQPVNVLHFVARGTIEHGMLELHRFKRDMFSGVLDGGENEVFLGASRLTRFMKTVETATGAIAEGSAVASPDEIPSDQEKILKAKDTEAEEDEEPVRSRQAEKKSHGPDRVVPDSLPSLLQAGASFLADLSRTMDRERVAEVKTDSRSGQKTLQIGLPDKKTLQAMTQAAGLLFDFLKRATEDSHEHNP